MKIKSTTGGSRKMVTAALVASLATVAVGGVSAASGSTQKAKTPAAHKADVGPRGGCDHRPSAAERAEHAEALASKLGVSVESVKSAMEALKPAAGTRPDRATFPARLAEKLGVSEASVITALDAVRPAHAPGPPR